jgi:hypothetical protein
LTAQLRRLSVMAFSGQAATHKPHALQASTWGAYAIRMPCTRTLSLFIKPSEA